MSDLEDQALSRAEVEARRDHQPRLSLFDVEGSGREGAGSQDDNLERRLVLIVAGSGSKGNSSIVYDRVSGEGILIDAGICKRDVLAACAEGGFDLAGLKGIFISHSHSDHVKNLGVILRGLRSKGIDVPLYLHQRSLDASRELQEAARSSSVEYFGANGTIDLGELRVTILPTSHDTEVSFGFRIDAGSDALGFVTDTGIVLPEALSALEGARIIGLESNHDTTMLRNGPYPRVLQERVASDQGHLSNDQAAAALEELLRGPAANSIETVVALHISENNNTYRLPVETLRGVVDRCGSHARVTCAYQKRTVVVS